MTGDMNGIQLHTCRLLAVTRPISHVVDSIIRVLAAERDSSEGDVMIHLCNETKGVLIWYMYIAITVLGH